MPKKHGALETMKKNQMPSLRPIPIKTKNVSFFKAVWTWMTERRKWEFRENWKYELSNNTTILIERGYIFDGASIPKVFWWLFSPTGILFIPSVFHDYAYTHGYLMSKREDRYSEWGLGSPRIFWDELFKTIADNVNGMAIINNFINIVIFLFAGFAWDNCQKSREKYQRKL